MKQVLILRHANWDLKDDTLTTAAKERCTQLKSKLPTFAQVFSSPLGRSVETAEILSGRDPVVDNRVSFPTTNSEIAGQIALARLTHPLGVAGAIFAIPAAREPYRAQAKLFIELINDTLKGLKDGQTGLFVSHDGIMVAVEKVLDNDSFEGTDHTFGELEGYFLDDQLNQTPFRPDL